jgi:hypothetical protein
VKTNSQFGGGAPAVIVLAALLVAGLAETLPGDTPLEIGGFRCDWKTEPTVIRTYDIAKAVERIAAVDPEDTSRADLSLYWTAVSIIKGSTGRCRELVNDRQWEKDHLTLDRVRLTIVAPAKVQDEFAKTLRAWEQGGLAQIAVGTQLIFDASDPPSKMFLVKCDRMVVVNDQQADELIEAAGRRKFYFPKITTFNGQQATLVQSLLRESARGTDKDALTEIKLTWRAIENGDLTKMRLEGSLEVSTVGVATSAISSNEPAELIKRLSAGGDANVDGRQNERRHQLSFRADLPDGHAVLPVRVPTRDGKQCFYLLITARRIAPPLPVGPGPPAATKSK